MESPLSTLSYMGRHRVWLKLGGGLHALQPSRPNAELFVGCDHLVECTDEGRGTQIGDRVEALGFKEVVKRRDHGFF